MDSITFCNFIICIGVLQQSSLYHVDGILFQVPEMVEWSKAELTCQKNHGTLFKPNEALFDVSLFSECNFKEDLWVAATYTNILNFESASRLSGRDSVIRCGMCEIGERCGTTCLYKACGNRCNAICEGLFGLSNGQTSFVLKRDSKVSDNKDTIYIRDFTIPHFHVLLFDARHNWTEAKELCQKGGYKFGDMIQNASSLFSNGNCEDGCFWTTNIIQVQFQTTKAPVDEQGACGILHNDTLSFTSCNSSLHPLCERVAKPALETPRFNSSVGRNICILMNTKITSMTTTQASRRINRINATMKTLSTYGASSEASDIAKRTTNGLSEENSSILVPVGATTSRNDLEDSPHKSDTGIIIGAVLGSVVFLTMTVLVIICFRRKLLQRTGKRKSSHDRNNTKMQKTDAINKLIYSDQCQDVPLETGSGLTPFAQLESKCEGSYSGIVGEISNTGKPAYMLDPEGSNFNYATVTKKVNLNSSNSNSNDKYDSYDHLNGTQEGRHDNVTGNVYDTANFKQTNGCIITHDSIYNISGERGKARDESVGLYDRVNTTISDEYDTTYDLRTDGNATYDHI